MKEKIIKFYENFSEIKNNNYLQKDQKQIEKEFYEMAKKLKNEKLLKSKSLVGFVKTKNYILEFYPKIWKELNDEKKEIRNIVELFKYAFLNEKLIHESMPLRKLEKTDSIYELFIKLYMFKLEKAIKDGFYFEYTERFDDSNYSKGKIEVKKQINKIDKSKFSIDFYEYDVNNILNQNIKYANYYLINNIEDFNLKKDLIKIINQFPEEISKTYYWVDKEIIFSKLNDRFEIPYNYASNLVRNRSSFTEYGKKKYLWFLFDMNKVFENFVANFLIKNKNKIFENHSEIKIIPQKGNKNFIFEESNESKNAGLRITRPDILIEYSNKKIIIDTKYKIIKDIKIESNEDDENFIDDNSISNNDLYQIFTYSQTYGSIINILLYPSMNETLFKGPYYFVDKLKDIRFYYGFINLNFTEENWENNMICDLKNSLQKIINNKSIG